MALIYKAAAACHWFGVDYAAGDPIDTTGYGPEDIVRLVKHLPVYVVDDAASGGSGTDAGTTIGTSAIVAGEVVVTYTSKWGIHNGQPYYDSAGALPVEAAILTVNPTTGDPVVVHPNGANA